MLSVNMLGMVRTSAPSGRPIWDHSTGSSPTTHPTNAPSSVPARAPRLNCFQYASLSLGVLGSSRSRSATKEFLGVQYSLLIFKLSKSAILWLFIAITYRKILLYYHCTISTYTTRTSSAPTFRFTTRTAYEDLFTVVPNDSYRVVMPTRVRREEKEMRSCLLSENFSCFSRIMFHPIKFLVSSGVKGMSNPRFCSGNSSCAYFNYT